MRCGLLLIGSALCLLGQTDPSAPDKGIIAGKVLNSATGEPVRKAKVSLFSLNEKSPGGWSAVTEAAGNFEIAGLPPGTYTLAVAHEGFVPPNNHGKVKQQRVVLAAGEEKRDLVVRLTPFGVVLGRILDEDGDPIRRMEVTIMQWHYSSSGRGLEWMAGATTDDRGEYRIFDLTPGRYYLKSGATHMTAGNDESFAAAYYPGTPDPPSAAAIDVGAGQEVQGIDLTLRRTHVATIRGRVMNPSAEAAVNLTTFREGGSSTSNSNSAPDGKFVIGGVMPRIVCSDGPRLRRRAGAQRSFADSGKLFRSGRNRFTSRAAGPDHGTDSDRGQYRGEDACATCRDG